MALVSERYYNSSEHRSSVTRVTSSKRSVQEEERYYEKRESENADFNSNYSQIEDFESLASFSQTSSPSKRSSIPVLKGSSLGSLVKQGSLDTEEEEFARLEESLKKEESQASDVKTGVTEQSSRSPRKVKRRLVRKVKKRGSSDLGEKNQEPEATTETRSDTKSADQPDNQPDVKEERPVPRIFVSARDPAVKSTPVKVAEQEPIHITFNRSPKDPEKEEPKQKRRDRSQRAKTAPVTLKIKPSNPVTRITVKNRPVSESFESESDSSENEVPERKTSRTSIRIVPPKKPEKESGGRKLEINAKSTKRATSPANQSLEQSSIADEIYREKTRNLNNRKVLNRRSVTESDLKARRIKSQESSPSKGRFNTLPRNFKTVRLPIQKNKNVAAQTQIEQEFSEQKRLRRLSVGSHGKSEVRSETPQSITSTQSYDPSPKRKLQHSCRLDGINFEEESEDGPRVIRRTRQNRRTSNPNQILGRTDIQGLRKTRPKSESIGLTRSASLPRSAVRPRVKSESYNEFVTIHDFEDFNLSKSRTLPYRKKRVSYEVGTKGQDTEGQRTSSVTQVDQLKDFEFQRHLSEHQIFQENNQRKVKTQNEISSKSQSSWVERNANIKSFSEEVEDENVFVSPRPNASKEKATEDSKTSKVASGAEVKEKDSGSQASDVVKGRESSIKRTQSLPRQKNKSQLDAKQIEFDEFIRNQRNLLLKQLTKGEQGQETTGQKSSEVNTQVDQTKGIKVEANRTEQGKVKEEVIQLTKQKTENQGRRIEEFLIKPKNSEKGRRHKSTNDVEDIQRALKVQRSSSSSQWSEQQSQFLLQNSQEAKLIEKEKRSRDTETIRVFARGKVIQLSMESTDQEKFNQRQREYDELQQRQQQQQRTVEDDRYRYMNNEFDRRNVTKGYYQTEQQVNERSSRSQRKEEAFQNHSEANAKNGVRSHSSTSGQQNNDTAQVTRVQRHQVEGGLDQVFYSICTHYFYPEDHELIVNLHRYGQIKVPTGLDHEETCIFYNHLYVYEKEDVFAETLAPIPPKIQTEIIEIEEEDPVFREPDDETMSLGSSANQSYDYNNDDASSQYSSASRRDRNLYSSLRAQQYYESKCNNNNNNNENSSFDKAFGSTYETLRNKRKSTNTDDESLNGFRAISPNSSSGRSETFSYSKPRLLRRSQNHPGVGQEVEDDYPRWRPKSPTQPDRVYGLSIGLPPE